MVSGEEYKVEQVLKKIENSKSFIDASKGGVTISGGEPLLQAEFILELFKELKKRNIHTAIDTAGGVEINDTIKELLKYTDLVLLDIKHIDNEKCKNLTGKSNENTLNFAKYLSENNIPMWIRQVLVPGLTDDEKDLIDLKEFIKTLNSVEKVEVLPYHDLGKYKWKEMGLKYPLEGYRLAEEKDVKRAKEILEI